MKIYLFKNEVIKDAYNYLNQHDLNYLNNFHFNIKNKKINSILLQKYVIMLNFNIKPKDIVIKRKDNKPFFNDTFFYSVSYSKEYIIIVTSNKNIGIDIEYINYKLNNVLYNIFIDDTFKYTSSKENTLLWTKIESYLKLIGCGLKGLKHLKYQNGIINHDNKNVQYYNISHLLPKNYYGYISNDCVSNDYLDEIHFYNINKINLLNVLKI